MRNNEKLLGLMMALSLLSVKNVYAVPNLHVEKCVNHSTMTASMPAASLVTHRPPVAQRLFRSEVIDRKIAEVKKLLKGNPYLAWLFENCYPNTLDTTVHYAKDSKGDDDTFVYT